MYRCVKWFVVPSTIFAAVVAATCGNEDQSEWQRVKRVTVYNSPRRARYPAITEAADGSLLVLFTISQQKAALGNLMLVRSADNGQTWSRPHVVYEAKDGRPRAFGMMTTLRSGQVFVPFAVMSDGQTTCTVRILISGNDGKTWQTSDPKVTCPLVWWAPSGRVIEQADGTLVMPVYGAASQDDLKATIHNCGLLRSGDEGKTWDDFSWIAKGGQPMIGAAPGRKFSFEGPSVQPLAGGGWLAMVTARRLNASGNGPTKVNEGPGSPQVLCRLWSADQGRTWSKPDQLMPGAWPSTAVVGGHTLLANTIWGANGVMQLEVSRDGFKSYFQEVCMMDRNWTRGNTNRPQETLLPPTVPFMTGGWPIEHYGLPSLLPLDEDNLVVVFNRPQRGFAQIDGPDNQKIPGSRERIQAVFYRRTISDEPLAAPLATKPAGPRGRWVLAERIIVPDIQYPAAMAQLPNGDLITPIGGKVSGGYLRAMVGGKMSRSSDGGRTWQEMPGVKLPPDLCALGVLKSGRWLAATLKTVSRATAHPTKVGMVGGYPTFKLRGVRYDFSIIISYSDDQGKTWQAGEPFKGPLQWAHPSVSHFIESPDGTVSLPIFGCVTKEESDSYSSSNGVIRSSDGGRTWGDFSFIFRTQPAGPGDYQSEPRYSEMDVVQLANGHWVAYSRNEHIAMGPRGYGATEVTVSTDFGRTWRKTGGSLVNVSQQKGVVLPDGGVALTSRSHSWQQPAVAITYDEGRSFVYALAGPYETVGAFLISKDEFAVFTARTNRSDMSAGVYRWVPDAQD